MATSQTRHCCSEEDGVSCCNCGMVTTDEGFWLGCPEVEDIPDPRPPATPQVSYRPLKGSGFLGL